MVNENIWDVISEYIKEDYNNILKAVYDASDKSIDWLISSTLSRNMYLSDIFFDLCKLEYIRRKKNDKNKNINLKSDKYYFIKTIKQFCLRNGIVLNYSVFDLVKNILRNFIRPYYKLLISVLYSLKSLSLYNKKRQRKFSSEKEYIFIETFVLSETIQSGVFKDRYYGNLFEQSNDIPNEIVILPHISHNILNKKTIKVLEKSNLNFIFKNDFLKLSDYIFALMHVCRINKSIFKNIYFKEFEISKILINDYNRNKFELSLIRALLNYRFIKRIKEKNIKIKLFIDWFENQTIDKGMIKGMKDNYPLCYIKGYQGFIAPLKYNFHLIPTELEVNNRLIPDEIVVTGKMSADAIKQTNPNLNVTVGPALRFSHLHSLKLNYNIKSNNILVALPISVSDSFFILKMLLEVNDISNMNTFYFKIKPHPALNIVKLFKKLSISRLPDNMNLINDRIDKCLEDSFVLISSNSSTCIESISLGVPVIIIDSSETISQNPIPETINKNIWNVCYNAKDVVKSVYSFKNYSIQQINDNAKTSFQILSDCFEKVSQYNLSEFLSVPGR